MSKLDELGNKHKRFVEEYTVDWNGTQAAIRAGYAANSAGQQAYDLLKKPEIQDAIAEVMAERQERCNVSVDKVIGELARLAFANMMDYMQITSDGDPYVDLSQLTRAQAAGILEFTVDDFMDGRGDDAREVKRVRIKLHDKKGPLIELGKHLGLFRGEGKGGQDEGSSLEAAAAREQQKVDHFSGIADHFAAALPAPKTKKEKV